MTTTRRAWLLPAGCLVAGGLAAAGSRVSAQPPAAVPAPSGTPQAPAPARPPAPQAPPTGAPFDPSKVPAGLPAPRIWTAQQDHQDMMDQLGIKTLRPGPSGTETAPNHANYDESLANPYPHLPDVLTLKNGRKVTSAVLAPLRRKEIIEDFDREGLGPVPANGPKSTWTVPLTVDATAAGHAAPRKDPCGARPPAGRLRIG